MLVIVTQQSEVVEIILHVSKHLLVVVEKIVLQEVIQQLGADTKTHHQEIVHLLVVVCVIPRHALIQQLVVVDVMPYQGVPHLLVVVVVILFQVVLHLLVEVDVTRQEHMIQQ